MAAPAKHVIFLGAGASHASGYPLANGLRLRISSLKNWDGELRKYQGPNEEVASKGADYWKHHEEGLKLFREGGFATLDEFCNLADRSQLKNGVNKMRGMVRAALGIFNPEDHFETSEYYNFVQALFKDDLVSLRDDISVLSYNYDPYLPFLLSRAIRVRYQVKRTTQGVLAVQADHDHDHHLNSVTSGFYSPTDGNWLTVKNGPRSFCFLQLHGSICFPTRPSKGVDYTTLFESERNDRASQLFDVNDNNIIPILFPWEIGVKSNFANQSDFPFNDGHLQKLFQGVWERAKSEVQAATKISFVGLSMHQFMFDGLKFLFDGKEDKVEIVIANPDTASFIGAKREKHWQKTPHSPGSVLSNMLKQVAPKMARFGMFPGEGPSDGDFTLVNDFGEFIRTQMRSVGN